MKLPDFEMFRELQVAVLQKRICFDTHMPSLFLGGHICFLTCSLSITLGLCRNRNLRSLSNRRGYHGHFFLFLYGIAFAG